MKFKFKMQNKKMYAKVNFKWNGLLVFSPKNLSARTNATIKTIYTILL